MISLSLTHSDSLSLSYIYIYIIYMYMANINIQTHYCLATRPSSTFKLLYAVKTPLCQVF